MGLARKRKTPGSDMSEITELSSLNLKGETMDVSITKQCLILLKKLMDHQFGWVFNQPVDPVQLNIPDYFSIIKNPMDLGTIKENLVKRKYASTVQFSSDVRLTFSNAMVYNPPTNEVHIMAKNLSNVFDARWRLLEHKWAKENPKFNLIYAEEKSRKGNPNPSSGLAKAGPVKNNANLAITRVVNAIPAEPSKKVRILVQGSAGASCKGEGVDKPQSCVRIEKRNDNGRLIFKLGSSNRPLCANNDKCNSREAISHNPTLSKKEVTVTHEKLCGARVPEGDKKSAPDRACGVHQRQPLPCTSSAAASEKEFDQFPLEEPLSPSRALRAAMLKSRFADTIVKAQQRTLLDQGNTVDPVKLQLEREKLERRQQEEKVRIEAKVRAAQTAARIKAEADRKLKREQEREAARLALQQMKKTVDLDNSELLKELERLNCSWTWHACRNGEFMQNLTCGIEAKSGFLNPLEKLGLFIKDDDVDDEDSGIPSRAEMEEGEILTL